MATPFPNQPPPFEGHDLFAIDGALQAAVARDAAGGAALRLSEWGATLGASSTYALADAANRNPPALRSYDRRGERIDDVSFHPAWDELMRLAMSAGEHCAPWRTPQPGAQVARAAMYYLHAQVENGTQCPLTMTYASVPVLTRHAGQLPDAADVWLPRILARRVRSARAAGRAEALGADRHGHDRAPGRLGRPRQHHARGTRMPTARARITGHKWFFSAPQCDAHLVLAQTHAGLGCFLMPRINPDGSRNAIRINRLKDKLGNRSNASAEVEFERALAWPVGRARPRHRDDPRDGAATRGSIA